MDHQNQRYMNNLYPIILSPPERDLLRHFVPRKLSNGKMLWKSGKIFRADMRGMATVEK